MKKINKAAFITLALALVGGCATENSRHSAVVGDLTPELLTVNRRPVDAQNMTSLTWNTDNRLLWDDLSRGALTDRPSRLSKYPVPH